MNAQSFGENAGIHFIFNAFQPGWVQEAHVQYAGEIGSLVQKKKLHPTTMTIVMAFEI